MIEFSKDLTFHNSGYNFDEITKKAIINVIKFLNEVEFDKNTFLNDIRAVNKYININKGHFLIKEFYNTLKNYLNKHSNEVTNFVNILNNDAINPHYQNALYHFYFPFKHSKNLTEHKIFFQEFFYIDTLEKLIYFLMDPKLKNKNIENKIREILAFDIHDLEDLKIAPRFSNKKKEYKDGLDIFNPELINETNYIGDYGENYVFKELKEKYKGNPNMEVIWVAKDMGDAYGYDIMLFNKKTNFVDLIEVKTTFDDEQENKFSLTPYERHTFRFSEEVNNTKYHIYRCYFDNKTGNLINEYDIYNDNNTIKWKDKNNKEDVIDKDDNGFYYIVKKVIK